MTGEATPGSGHDESDNTQRNLKLALALMNIGDGIRCTLQDANTSRIIYEGTDRFVDEIGERDSEISGELKLRRGIVDIQTNKAQAQREFQEAVAIQKKLTPQNEVLTGEALFWLGDFMLRYNDTDAAIEYLTESEQVLARSGTVDAKRHLMSVYDLHAEALLKNKKLQEATDLWTDTLLSPGSCKRPIPSLYPKRILIKFLRSLSL